MSTPVLKKHYRESVVPELKKILGVENIHQVPSVQKVVINSAFGADNDRNYVEEVSKKIGLIVGQKPIVTRATKSISNFKLRQGMPIGVKVTLRGARMYEFLYRLMAIALPTIRDFQGVNAKFDGCGNYSLGIADHTIFPEITVDSNRKNIGMDITIVTSTSSDREAQELLRLLGMPFRKRPNKTAEATTPALAEAAH